MVLTGTYDAAVPVVDARWIATHLQNAHFVELQPPICPMSKPQRPSQKPSPHSSPADAPPSNDRHATGLVVRRAVLGEAHVDRAQAELTDFNRDFDDLITRFAWGEIWTRPGLPASRAACSPSPC